MSRHGTFSIFSERELQEYLDEQSAGLKQHVYNEAAEYLLNVNEEQYLSYLEETYGVEPLVIDFDNVSVSSREEQIEAERFPGFDFNVRRGSTYPKQVITYHVPFSGNGKLLAYKPTHAYLLWTQEVYISEGCICFDVIDLYGDPEKIKSKATPILNNMRQQAEHVAVGVSRYKQALRDTAKVLVAARRQQLQSQNKVVSSLGVPIRKKEEIPPTFAVPTVRKKIMSKPAVSRTVAAPVPALDQAIYDEILQTIYEMGKVFERYPSTYAGKHEEALRDHLILQLEPRFEGSTTGETFNRSGKTDILIRHEKSNIFVAECKFWDGRAQHLKTIDQVLAYLTWRDSKTAIVYFVNRKEITPALAEIAKTTSEHPCFVRGLGQKDPSWQMFEFHLPGDLGCRIQMAILAFHIPGP